MLNLANLGYKYFVVDQMKTTIIQKKQVTRKEIHNEEFEEEIAK